MLIQCVGGVDRGNVDVVVDAANNSVHGGDVTGDQGLLKTVYALTSSGEPVTTGLLAHELGVSSPSVSAMAKRLTAEEQFLERPDGRVLRLTELGEHAALRVIRRHRLLETFLATMLAVPWDEVHAEAELLEHAVSDRLEDRIDAALGHPTRDPHGDPIPPRTGPHDDVWGEALDAAPAGCWFRVQRVSDRDSAALRYLGGLGIVPGVPSAGCRSKTPSQVRAGCGCTVNATRWVSR
ncbi:iron dependent repressor, metal binding and dimerization domain protein [Pseudonocardia sp. GCM10023141]|uniref:metal-dependent transcriptional regulator n=1 Tax=Pseudonocardia sp. GCM10023141 TaxID=3252653 RepID=UPI0036140BE3